MMLFPLPRNIEMLDGVYRMKKCFRGCDLVSFYKEIQAGTEDVKIQKIEGLSQEEYCLNIDENGIFIKYSTDEGLFRAATSLHQLVKRGKGEVQYTSIQDKPDIRRRGYMLDINGGCLPKVETIKRMIDFLAALKYNELQLYMEGDCFKYAAYPKETADFDCLTPEDIQELDKYCRERFIDLVPNQNSFGHMHIWLGKPEFRHLGLFEGDEVPFTLNPVLPESFEFMKNLYASLLPNFSSKYVNIGLDEAYGLGKFQIEEYCREKGNDAVFMEWLNKLSAHIASEHGKTVMFWADMIYNYPESYHLVPKDAVALEWGYELIQSQRMTDHCIAYKNAGVRYYVCPSCNTHGAFTSRMDVTTFNIRTCAELAVEYGAEGILLTDWSDSGLSLWSMTPCALCGQYGWNTGKAQDGESFKADFIRASEGFVDEYAFEGKKVSRLMYRMANYYLLEPERVHVCTMCAKELTMPVSETKYAHLFDLKDSGDDFYFDNVIGYVRRVMADIEKIDFDERKKQEIRLTALLIELGSEVCKIKLNPRITKEKAEALAQKFDLAMQYHLMRWNDRYYEKDREKFLDMLKARKQEILELQ